MWEVYSKRTYAILQGFRNLHNTKLPLKHADQNSHILVGATSCEKVDCLKYNCAQVVSRKNDCPLISSNWSKYCVPYSTDYQKFETKIAGNLTHTIPKNKDGVVISTKDYNNDMREQSLVFGEDLPKVQPHEVVVNRKVSSYVQKKYNHAAIMGKTSVKSHKSLLIKSLENAKDK